MDNHKHKQQLINLKDEYFITYNDCPVDVLDGGDQVLLVSIEEDWIDQWTMDWKEYEKQVIKNNGKICVE